VPMYVSITELSSGEMGTDEDKSISAVTFNGSGGGLVRTVVVDLILYISHLVVVESRQSHSTRSELGGKQNDYQW
jgi:hypothetical protein